MRSSLCAILGMVAVVSSLSAQAESDDTRLDMVLSSQAVTWEQAAWLVGRAVGSFDEGIGLASASDQALALGWAGSQAGLRSDSVLDLQTYSLLMVKALKVPTGVLYSLIPSPRYALRELVYDKIVPTDLIPEAPLSGEEALRYLQAAQDWEARR